MSDIEDYIRDISKWRGEVITSLSELNKNDDSLQSRYELMYEILRKIDNRITIIETKLKMISTILIPVIIAVLITFVDLIIKHII